jgi:glycosyltransferase involved in cell wall biosynthesis
MHSLSSVSVIVPVRNGEKTIEKLMEALVAQDYPKDRIQIIIVDNGSRDRTIEIIKKFPVMLAEENSMHSSYAARNTGLSLARGEIIGFTDADCIPELNWISAGVRALNEENADLAGGRVHFTFSARESAAEYFDSIHFLDNEKYVKNKRGAATANLFVRANVFKQIGLFPNVQSGGDMLLTGKALEKGFSLIYAPQAIVHHPTRNLKGVLKKYWRVSSISGHSKEDPVQKPSPANQSGYGYFRKLFILMRLLIPIPSKRFFSLLIANLGNPKIKNRFFALWGIAYLCQLMQFMALVYYFFKKGKK